MQKEPPIDSLAKWFYIKELIIGQGSQKQRFDSRKNWEKEAWLNWILHKPWCFYSLWSYWHYPHELTTFYTGFSWKRIYDNMSIHEHLFNSRYLQFTYQIFWEGLIHLNWTLKVSFREPDNWAWHWQLRQYFCGSFKTIKVLAVAWHWKIMDMIIWHISAIFLSQSDYNMKNFKKRAKV